MSKLICEASGDSNISVRESRNDSIITSRKSQGDSRAKSEKSQADIWDKATESSDSWDRIYLTFNYPGALPGGKTLLTGIRNEGKTLYITGFYQPPENSGQSVVSFLYKGNTTGKTGPCSENSWNVLNYPSARGRTVKATNLYGPQVLTHNYVRAVGNYTTVELGKKTIACLYEGPLNGSGKWITLTPSKDTSNAIAHSVHGNLVVGNYEIELFGKAFIYDIESEQYYEVVKPGAKSITAYGIWHNGDQSYTICGGFSDLGFDAGVGMAYLVDWDNHTHKLSNWREYQYQQGKKQAIVTHFDGITSDGNGGYNLTGDAVVLRQGPIAFFYTVNDEVEYVWAEDSQTDSQSESWERIQYPGSVSTSGNSVSKKIVIGVYSDSNEENASVNGYISLVL